MTAARRELLADGLVAALGPLMPRGWVWNLDKATGALLPLVDAMCAEAAADELRDAADAQQGFSEYWQPHRSDYAAGRDDGHAAAAERLRDRATVLHPSEGAIS